MIPTLYTVERSRPGRLSVLGRPRGGDWLDDELRALASVGVDAVVCALTPSEQEELALVEEQRAAEEAGLTFLAAPIPDRTVPDAQEKRDWITRLAREGPTPRPFSRPPRAC